MRLFLPTKTFFFSLYCPLINVVTDAASSISYIDTRRIDNSPAMQHDGFHIIILMESLDGIQGLPLLHPYSIPTRCDCPYGFLTPIFLPRIGYRFALAGKSPGDVLKFVDFALESLTQEVMIACTAWHADLVQRPN
jgi:hypothetical protein